MPNNKQGNITSLLSRGALLVENMVRFLSVGVPYYLDDGTLDEAELVCRLLKTSKSVQS